MCTAIDRSPLVSHEVLTEEFEIDPRRCGDSMFSFDIFFKLILSSKNQVRFGGNLGKITEHSVEVDEDTRFRPKENGDTVNSIISKNTPLRIARVGNRAYPPGFVRSANF